MTRIVTVPSVALSAPWRFAQLLLAAILAAAIAGLAAVPRASAGEPISATCHVRVS